MDRPALSDRARRRAEKYGRKRMAAMRGETVPLTVPSWIRFTIRAIGILALLIVFVPLHYLYRIFAYGSPFPMLFPAAPRCPLLYVFPCNDDHIALITSRCRRC